MPIPQLPQFAMSSKMGKLAPLRLQNTQRGTARGMKKQKESPVASCEFSETKTLETLAQILGVPQQSAETATKRDGADGENQVADENHKLVRLPTFLL